MLCAAADSGDNTVIAQVPDFRIPASSIITCVAVVIKRASNLSTHLANIQIGSASGLAADAAVSHGVEILGAGVANTDCSGSTSAEDIDMVNDVNEVWICRDTVIVGGNTWYVYVCNAGTGNGTTSAGGATTPILTINIEYYGTYHYNE